MKSPFSPSPSSSSSFDANNMCTSGGGCLVGVLRRLLCSDRIDDVNSLESPSNYNGQKQSNGIEASISSSTSSPLGPGLVARLMGLDSMPDFTPIAPNSVLRSRFMNSAMDHCENLKQEQHRRAKTSVSFREMPTFLDQENDEYLVLSFEELEPNERECEMVSSKVKQRRSQESKNKENRTEKAIESKKKRNQETEEMQNRRFSVDFDDTVPRLKPLNRKEICDEEQLKRRRRRRRKKKKKMSNGGDTIQKLEADSSSEDSSPVSVLDFSQLYDNDPEFQSDLNSRRKLSQQLEKHEQPCPSSDQETEASEGSFIESRKQDCHSCETGLWGSICRLTQGDLVTESNWSYRRTCNFEDFGDMCEDLEVQILDQLFHELVLDQLCWS